MAFDEVRRDGTFPGDTCERGCDSGSGCNGSAWLRLKVATQIFRRSMTYIFGVDVTMVTAAGLGVEVVVCSGQRCS